MRKDYLIKSITQYIFFFFLGAFLGYLWEVLLFYVQDGVFCNRGFLYGPWFPVYGVGAVLMLLILRRFQKHPVKVFFLAVLLGSFVELFIGWFLAQVFHLRYWDYHDYPLQLGGYICLYSALGFGIAGVLWVCVFARIASHLWEKNASIPTTHFSYAADTGISFCCSRRTDFSQRRAQYYVFLILFFHFSHGWIRMAMAPWLSVHSLHNSG